jgi:hypothetical protein
MLEHIAGSLTSQITQCQTISLKANPQGINVGEALPSWM